MGEMIVAGLLMGDSIRSSSRAVFRRTASGPIVITDAIGPVLLDVKVVLRSGSNRGVSVPQIVSVTQFC
jgi:hypothetical protein